MSRINCKREMNYRIRISNISASLVKKRFQLKKSQVYLAFRVGNTNYETSTVAHNASIWTDIFEADLLGDQSIYVQVFDKKMLGRKLVGDTVIDLRPLYQKGFVESSNEVISRGKIKGTVTMRIELLDQNAPSLGYSRAANRDIIQPAYQPVSNSQIVTPAVVPAYNSYRNISTQVQNQPYAQSIPPQNVIYQSHVEQRTVYPASGIQPQSYINPILTAAKAPIATSVITSVPSTYTVPVTTAVVAPVETLVATPVTYATRLPAHEPSLGRRLENRIRYTKDAQTYPQAPFYNEPRDVHRNLNTDHTSASYYNSSVTYSNPPLYTDSYSSVATQPINTYSTNAVAYPDTKYANDYNYDTKHNHHHNRHRHHHQNSDSKTTIYQYADDNDNYYTRV